MGDSLLVEGVPAGKMLGLVDYIGVRDVGSAHHGFILMGSFFPWTSLEEVFT